ncbi:MAG: hypothetical protein ACI4E5_06610 [Suilimivivens sp.]
MNIASKKRNLIFVVIMAVLLLGQLALLFYYGNQKAGFHEDELYTFYSTNKTAGLFVNDRQWAQQEELRNDFVVLPGEQFRYNVVKQMQSWDVHPPIYYYIFHTACSLFPDVFSKWLGISVNMIAFVGSFLLLAYGAYMAAGEQHGKMMAFLSCLGWGFSSAVISGVMFIRMYQWLTLFILLCMDLHLRAMKKQDFRILSFYLPLSITVFLGFLTQYYYIIFHFFLGAGFCLLLLKNKKMKELLAYFITCAAGLGLAICYYPSSLAHIFRGYRGTEAVSEFSNASNTFERLRFFYGLFDDFVMNGTLSIWLLLICIGLVTRGYLKKRGKVKGSLLNASAGLMLFAALGYFFTIAKTALLLGETSNRYQLPVYGILIFLILYVTWKLADGMIGNYRIMAGALALVLVLIDGLALKNDRVFFLYTEEKEIMEFVKEHAEEPVVVFYNEASADHVWWLSDELIQYPKVYFASQGNRELIKDETITNSRRLLVYVADYENQEECLKGILRVNKNLKSYQVVGEKKLWTLYEFS